MNYEIKKKTMKQNQIDLYSLLESHEKEHICEIVGEAIARTYGTDEINNFVWDLFAERIEE
tara:strand:+ start:220 stop:402 length:183 start_codon:yes stop_codon:yes gene_type:complete